MRILVPGGLLLLLCAAAFLSGCGRPMFEVIHGNYRFTQGEFAQATISYMKALGDTDQKQVLYYNLGNVYHALGEIEPAISSLDRAHSGAEDQELRSRAHFNLGNIFYELGEYDRAVSHYIDALSARPNDVETKVNLELALKKMSSDRVEKQESTAGVQRRKPLDKEYQSILSLVKEKEEKLWQSQHTGETERFPNDW
ncbi:MAG TPA: tetratricopeptide repeat protein [Spirochaetia bacterium]|nr:tetratricopeptide repeat protein [Spirochaetia bacterium]